MRKLLVTTTLLAADRRSAAIAQTASTRSRQIVRRSQSPWPAPVGHRQPRADQVPSEKNLSDPNNPVNREDAALDRKIKSICRGC